MDWANEQWRKLFVRDTDSWLLLSWLARALFVFMLRKVDRAGVLETKRGPRGVAALVGMPLDQVEPALAELLEDGCVAIHDVGYVIPNFLDAQEARQSDAKRQRESRERRRGRSPAVTEGDDMSDVVTLGHTLSHDVTKEEKEERDKKEESDPARELAVVACDAINGLARTQYRPDSEATLKFCRKLAKARVTPDQLRSAITHVGRPWLGTAYADKIRPQTLLQFDRVRAALDDINAGNGRNANNNGGRKPNPLPSVGSIVFEDGTEVRHAA